MPKKKYRQSLQDLHAQISKTKPVDKEMAGELKELTHDIRRILEHPGESPFELHHELLNKLEGMVTRFEATHPTLTTSMRGVINTLNSLGI